MKTPDSGHIERLFSLPVRQPGRPKLHERVRKSGPALDRAARKFLTLAKEYAERDAYERARSMPEPTYPERLRRLSAGMLTTRRAFVPDIPTGEFKDVLSYIRRYDAKNHHPTIGVILGP